MNAFFSCTLFVCPVCVCACSCFANPYPCLSTPSPLLCVLLFCMQPFVVAVVAVVAHMKMKNCLTAGQTGQITQNTHPTHTHKRIYIRIAIGNWLREHCEGVRGSRGSNASRVRGREEVVLGCRDCGYVFTSLRCGYVTCN